MDLIGGVSGVVEGNMVRGCDGGLLKLERDGKRWYMQCRICGDQRLGDSVIVTP